MPEKKVKSTLDKRFSKKEQQRCLQIINDVAENIDNKNSAKELRRVIEYQSLIYNEVSGKLSSICHSLAIARIGKDSESAAYLMASEHLSSLAP